MKHLKEKIIFQATEQTVEDAIIGLIQGYETAKGYFMNRPKVYPDLEKTLRLELESRAETIREILS
jgi:hypothetical protein